MAKDKFLRKQWELTDENYNDIKEEIKNADQNLSTSNVLELFDNDNENVTEDDNGELERHRSQKSSLQDNNYHFEAMMNSVVLIEIFRNLRCCDLINAAKFVLHAFLAII